MVPEAYEGNSGLNGRVVFGRDGMVYMSTGGNIAKVAQDPASLRGKILRLRDDGSVPPDNPFASRAGYRPEIYTLGHRNTLGLIVHPRDRRAVEQRKRSERRRRNQHHPAGPQLRMAASSASAATIQARASPSIRRGRAWSRRSSSGFRRSRVAGMAVYTGDRFPAWKGNVFVGR